MREHTTLIYWDTQDPHNEGWAYRQNRNGQEESGPVCDDLHRNASAGDIIRAAASELGVETSSIVLARDWQSFQPNRRP